jgi:hypothetical protein
MCIFFQVEPPKAVAAALWGIAAIDIGADSVPDTAGEQAGNTVSKGQGVAAAGQALSAGFIDAVQAAPVSLSVSSGASWTVSGNTSVATLTDDGTLSVLGSLAITGSIDPASDGVIDLGAAATLSVQNVLGGGPAIAFLSADQLVINQPGSFGANVGSGAYVGPLLENFGATGTIDLVGIATGTGLVLNYATSSGVLTITAAADSTPVASLAFQASSLGAGTFHLRDDGHGGVFLTHS